MPVMRQDSLLRLAPESSVSNPVRVLHAVGHLSRGGIERWVFQLACHTNPVHIEHHVLVRTTEEEPFTRQFRDAGINVVSCTGVTSPLRFAQNFKRVLAQHGPFDVVHAHGVSMFTVETLLLARLIGIRARILHAHNDLRPRLAHASLLYKIYTALNLRLLRKLSNKGLACGAQAAEWSFGHRWLSRKPRIDLMTGIDMRRCLQPAAVGLREELGLPTDRFIVAQVGRFTIAKNHDFTLRIAKELAARGCPCHFLLIGDGELRKQIVEGAALAGLAGNFTFVPDASDVPRILRGAVDVQILPSIHEGLPLVLLEGQASGVLSLVSDTVTREGVVDSSLVSFLPIDRGADLWADAIVRSIATKRNLEDDALFRERMLKSRFNIEQNAVAMTDLYRAMARSTA